MENEESKTEVQSMEVGAVSVENISTNNGPTFINPNSVTFLVKYPKDYKGEKSMVDGERLTVSKESAEHFTKLGIGQIVK